MWRVQKSFQFSACHKIENGRDCGNIHGHLFSCKISIEDCMLNSEGKLIEKKDLDNIARQVISNLEGTCILHERNKNFVFLNCKTVFLPVNPTIEELSKVIYEFVKRRLRECGYENTLDSIELSTEEGFFVEFYED